MSLLRYVFVMKIIRCFFAQILIQFFGCNYIISNFSATNNSEMEKDKSARRDFIKLASLGLGGFAASKKMGSFNINNDPVANRLNIVCVGAHPGDPEFGCGGTMNKYAGAGHEVTFLYLTRGEAYDSTISYSQAAALRTKEAEVSCKILNAKPSFAGQIDGNTILSKEKNEEMTKLILSLNPDIVFTHWPLDSHPDHQVSGLLTLTAWIRADKKFELYFYEVNTGSETMSFTPTDYVDISNEREKKKAAMFAHKTQSPVELYDSLFKTMEEFRGFEAGVKAAEGFIHFKEKAERANILGL
jgi:LmbE family N-acetylglucosaminyl deacetylase